VTNGLILENYTDPSGTPLLGPTASSFGKPYRPTTRPQEHRP
jgi:hypothetical protein